jgi:hypothetical protein
MDTSEHTVSAHTRTPEDWEEWLHTERSTSKIVNKNMAL